MALDANKNSQQREEVKMVNEKINIITCKYIHVLLSSFSIFKRHTFI